MQRFSTTGWARTEADLTEIDLTGASASMRTRMARDTQETENQRNICYKVYLTNIMPAGAELSKIVQLNKT